MFVLVEISDYFIDPIVRIYNHKDSILSDFYLTGDELNDLSDNTMMRYGAGYLYLFEEDPSDDYYIEKWDKL